MPASGVCNRGRERQSRVNRVSRCRLPSHDNHFIHAVLPPPIPPKVAETESEVDIGVKLAESFFYGGKHM